MNFIKRNGSLSVGLTLRKPLLCIVSLSRRNVPPIKLVKHAEVENNVEAVVREFAEGVSIHS